MALNEGQRRILTIIAEKANRTTSASVIDRAVINDSNMPEDEVRLYFSQLESLEYITMQRASGADFRLINLTKEGLEGVSEDQQLRL